VLSATSLGAVLMASYEVFSAIRAAHLTARPAFVGATNRIAGALLIGAGLRIAALPRGE